MISYADPVINRAAARAANAARTFSSIVAWTFGAIPFCIVVAGIIALLLSPETAFLGVAAACVLVIAAGSAARSTRRKRGRMLMGYLAQAMQMNLPISTMLLAAAKSEPRRVAHRIDRLRTALEDGSPLGTAVALAVPQVPQRIIDLANTAERNGRLPQVLARLVDEHYPSGREDRSLGFYGSYSLLVLLAVSALITLVSIFIMPRFEQIFKDFKTDLPPITRTVMQLGVFFAPIICLIALIATLVAEGRALRQLLTSAQPRPNPLKNIWDHLIWHAPIAGTLAHNRGLADVCTIIADGLDAGRPAEQSISEAVQPHLNAVLRKRVETWATLATGGMPLAEAANQASMPALISGLTGTAIRTGDLPGALRFLARHYESAFSRTAILLRAAAVPAVVLALGFVVMCIALALFAPMISLIQTVSAPVSHYPRYW